MRRAWFLGLLGQELLSQALEDSYPIPPGYAIARRIGGPPRPRALVHAPVARPAEWFTHEDRTEERGLDNHRHEWDGERAVVGDGPAEHSMNLSSNLSYVVPMDHTMIAAPIVANDTNATNATNASNSTEPPPPGHVKRNGFMGNPYTGVLVAPLTDRPIEDRAGRRLDVSRVKSIACLQRMIKEPDHECDADQLLPGDVNPGLVDSDPPNVHTTPATAAIKKASENAALAAKEALAAAEAAKAAAEAVKAAEKTHTEDVQNAVETASKAAADAAAATVEQSNVTADVEAAAHDAAKAAAAAAAEAAQPDTDAIQKEAEKAAVKAGTEAVGLNTTNATAADDAVREARNEDVGDAPAEEASGDAGADSGSSLLHARPKSALLHRLQAQPAVPTVLHHKLRRSQNLR